MNAAVELAPTVALVGNPNCGKTALFNALTGSRQKVANYPGVTVEKKQGRLSTPGGRSIQLLDLPGTYSLRARSPDEEITRDAVLGKLAGETAPDLIVCVGDASNLRLALRLACPLQEIFCEEHRFFQHARVRRCRALVSRQTFLLRLNLG